jgi:pimeloyl-ACP methyl ester carboxylesterase
MSNQPAIPIEREATFQSGSLRLAGTLRLPGSKEGPYPAVLLLSGSGPLDRDENMKTYPINAMREIAEHLAKLDIATFRYDKRGVGASQGEYFRTGFFNQVDDAAAALAWLRQQAEIQSEKVFVLGHSEGAGISVRLAGTGAAVAGIVLLGGWARSGEEMLLWQAEQVIPGMRGLNKWLINFLHIDIRKAQLIQFEKIKRSKKDCYRQMTVKVNAKWVREFLVYTPGEDLQKICVPVLAITGSKDIQIDPAEIGRMHSLVQGEFEGRVLPNVTHMLRVDLNPSRPTTQTYQEQIKKPVDPSILQIIGVWLQQQILRRLLPGRAVKMQ